ncbi:hypothetical protein [Streptomyces iconiensis]|uniref:Integral membrane protein n=1 Tax=Streptomyces iconiensis TaxID=1384038 RepID=A0ABT7A9U8_9ACTN|nr:hypothetical protein [Streptomyces iconiensis]MDJ1138113.1 hypothetical protein [Streptomyces iconiensis]
MTKLLLSLHVLAAILAVGPIAVAASMFPRYARQLAGHAAVSGPATGPATGHVSGSASGGRPASERAAAGAALLHRICRAYAVVGVAVPVLGLATGAQLGVLTDAWLIASLILTAAAAALLALAILPAQSRLLDVPSSVARASVARLAGLTGAFNLLWAVVVVLMIIRPGSTTGV